MKNNSFNNLTLIKVFPLVLVLVRVFKNLLARPSQLIYKMRGRVSDFIIPSLFTYNTRTDH